MLEAKKNRLFEKIFAVYNTNLMRRKFDSFLVSDIGKLRAQRSVPQIVVANHTGWWDGLVAFELSTHLGLDSYVMMEEKQLRRFWPFTRLGAFSVVREDPRSAAESIRYASELLGDDPERSLWIFPQGELIPFGSRPMNLFPGFARIIEQVGECRLVPLTIRYEYLKAHRASIIVSVGDVMNVTISGRDHRKELVSYLARLLTESEDGLRQKITSQQLSDDFIDILR